MWKVDLKDRELMVGPVGVRVFLYSLDYKMLIDGHFERAKC